MQGLLAAENGGRARCVLLDVPVCGRNRLDLERGLVGSG